MADNFVGEIRVVPFNFAPKGWAFCAGQLMPISQNTALFSLLGTTYGGDGKSTFALPDLQGRVPVSAGQGAGLSLYDLGQQTGEETVTLLTTEIPAHNHSVQAAPTAARTNDPTQGFFAVPVVSGSTRKLYSSAAPDIALAPDAVTNAGGSQPHNNLQPYLGLNYIIALQGIFPSRS